MQVDEVVKRWQAVPRLVFLDSCTMQWLHRYGGFVWEDEALNANDRITRQADGPTELAALAAVVAVSSQGALEFAVSRNSLAEIRDAGDHTYLQWAFDVADYWNTVVQENGLELSTLERSELAKQLDSQSYGYLGAGDRALLADAVQFGCDAFLTVEKKLVRNADHLQRTLDLRIMRPGQLWEILRPWAALYL